ncbi:MAG TPA: replication-relaxation family protein [Solirubrobacterales bacterium]|nr:replication-relaxation family protein [Solirubrobacterales bacterium]
MAGSSSSSGTRSGCSRSPSTRTPALSDLDRRILDLLSFLRVLTQTQLAKLMSPETPPRTVRYRTARLAKLGLIGRTRPYRERGSAPHHLWPTRKGEAIAEGGPPSRGGERREPNPLFLAHAASISELYVALKTGLPDGLELTGFEREAEAREAFRGYDGKEHAVAPDACIQVKEADGRVLLGLVELDLGTMSARQLKAKAEGYGEYVKREGWRQRNSYCPPLLFITTSEKRARSFLATCRRTVDRERMLVAATGSARDIGRALTAPKWLAGEREGVDLLAVLRGARRPYDEECEQREAERREKDAERERLRSDPAALREHLRKWRHRDWGIDRLGPLVATALEVTLERDEELAEAERQVLLALAAMFADPLHLQLAEGEPTPERQAVLNELVEYQRTRQLQAIEELAQRFGEGPALRKARGRLRAGELLAVADLSALRLGAEDDGRSRAEQERLRSAYLSSREERALYRWKSQRLFTRLHSGPEDFLEEIDCRTLRLCCSCEEVAYPDPERARYERGRRDVAFRCYFCDGRNLAEWEPSAGGRTTF